MSIQLNPEEYQQLVKEISEVFSSYDDLKLLCRFSLGVKLNTITSNYKNTREAANDLVEWAMDNEQIIELIKGACKQRPRNSVFQEFYNKYCDEKSPVNIPLNITSKQPYPVEKDSKKNNF